MSSRLAAHRGSTEEALMFFMPSAVIPPFIGRQGNLSKHRAESSRLIDDLFLVIQSLTCGLAILAHVVNQ